MRPIAPALVVLALATVAAADDFPRFEGQLSFSWASRAPNVQAFSFTDPGGETHEATDLCSAATAESLGKDGQQFFCERRGFPGGAASLTWNLQPHLGVQARLEGRGRSETFVDDFGGITQTIGVRERSWGFYAGLQWKENRHDRRWKPFAHALAGVVRYTDRQAQTVDAFPEFDYVAEDAFTSLALKLGGGLDVRLGRHVDLRAVEASYSPVFAKDRDFDTVSGPFRFRATGRTAHDFTLGAGFVIH